MAEAAIDFGGTVTNVLVASDQGERTAELASVAAPTEVDVQNALRHVEVEDIRALERLAVTGGQSAMLPSSIQGVAVTAVEETEAVAAGGILSGAEPPAIVISVGTGTGIVLATEDGGATRLVGSGVGGGTLVGLARLAVGEFPLDELGRLAAAGDPSRCDLKVGDILGTGVGPVSAEAIASHFGRVGRDGKTRETPADIMAALVGLVVLNALRIGLGEMLLHRARSMILIGGTFEVEGFVTAVRANPFFGGFPVHIGERPGLAVVRGALARARSTA